MKIKSLLGLATLAIVALFAVPARGDQRIYGSCEVGATTVNSQGILSTNQVQGSFPSCTVTVFVTGTFTLATIYGDNSRTPKANPFTAASNGAWFYYVPSGNRDDIVLSGGGFSSPVTLGDVLAVDTSVGPVMAQSAVAFNVTPVFNAATFGIFSMTLTGNVTSSTIPGGVPGQQVEFSLCQDGTGGRTFAWPATFLNPPTVDPTASACGQFAFILLSDTKWHEVSTGEAGSLPSLNITTDLRANGVASSGTGAFLRTAAPAIAAPSISNPALSGTITGSPTASGNWVFSGQTATKNLNQIRLADQFSGADCGSRINAADSDLGATAGEIWINQLCGLTISTNVVLSANHVIRWIQGGSWTVSGKITMNFLGNSLIGPGSGVFTLNCTTATSDCIRWQISPFSVDQAGAISGVRIQGNGGASQIGLHMGDMVGARLTDVYIDGFNGVSSVGLWWDNITNWTERTTLLSVTLGSSGIGNTVNWKISVSGGNPSFAYTRALDVRMNIGAAANQVGIQSVNNSLVYNGIWNFMANMAGATGTLMSIGGTSTWQFNQYDITAETTGSGTAIAVGSGASLYGCGELRTTLTSTNANAASNTPTFRITPLCFGDSSILDGGSIANYLGSGNAAVVSPIIPNGLTSPQSAFGFLNGTNIMSPYVAMFDSGSNAFEVYKWAFGVAPNAMVELARVDQAGNGLFTGNVIIGAHLNQSAALKFAGTCSMSAGTTCTATIATMFTGTPICVVTVGGGTAIAGACSVSGTTVTITAASVNSAGWGFILIGNPN